MDYISPFTDKVNAILGMIGALLVYLLGDHWHLFAAFLLLNIGDWVTGWMTARLTGTEQSHKGVTGILKKLGYWIMVALAFGLSVIFEEMGVIIGLDLGVSTLLGWFVLISLIVNEVRSILENLVRGGFKVPTPLVKGLEVANKLIEEVDESKPDADIFDDP